MVYFLLTCILCLVILYVIFKYYIKKYSILTWGTDLEITTPSHKKSGDTFFPISRWMLFGSHFQSIITVGTIFLPSISYTFGWLPALLLLLLGVSFSGWIHDYISTILSVRSDSETLPSLFAGLLGEKCGFGFWLLSVLCSVVLSSLSVLQCAIILEIYPTGFVSTLSVLVSGLVFTFLFYRRRSGLPIASLISFGIIMLGIGLSLVLPLEGLDRTTITLILYSVALLYTIIPNQYISQSVRFVASIPTMIVVVYIITVSAYSSLISPVSVPMFAVPSSADSNLLELFWFAFLFSSACGIVSGWHGHVGTSLTSRHIDLEEDIDVITAGSMFLESTLALGTLVLFTSMSSEVRLSAGGTPWEVLLVGLSNQVDEVFNIGSVTLFQQSLVVVLLAICCINSLQLAISLWRSDQYIPKRIPGGDRLGSFFFVSACLAISWFLAHSSSLLDLWFLFGGINQLLAGLTLMLGTVHLKQAGDRFPQTIVPSVLITLNSIAFLFYLSTWRFLDSLNLSDIFELRVFAQPFSQAVNVIFLITISLLSTAIGLWLTSETSELA